MTTSSLTTMPKRPQRELAAIITAENCRYAGREHYLKEE